MKYYVSSTKYHILQQSNGNQRPVKTVDDYHDAIDFVIDELEKWERDNAPDKKPAKFAIHELFVFPGKQVVEGFKEIYVPGDLPRLRDLATPSCDF